MKFAKQQNTNEAEAEILRNLIKKVSQQLLCLYYEIKNERKRLFREEYNSGDENFSVFGETELFSDAINGIAMEILKHGKHHKPVEAILTLKENDIFKIKDFVIWITSSDNYPGYYRYIMLTDYLRRLLIEYIQLYQTQNMYEEMDVLKWLEHYYLSCCDGDWEHGYGIKIDTLDNPGWSVDINLADTDFEAEHFEAIISERSEHDWVHCKVQDQIFKGRGGPTNLEEILEIFRKWVLSHEEQNSNRGTTKT